MLRLFVANACHPINMPRVDAGDPQVSVEPFVHLLQAPVAGGSNNRLVEFGIVPVVRCPVFIRSHGLSESSQ